jgi:uncharacterized membrane protein
MPAADRTVKDRDGAPTTASLEPSWEAIHMKTSLLAIFTAAITAVFAYVDAAAAATGGSAYRAGQVAGKVFLVVLVVLVVLSVVRRVKARSNTEG